MPHLKLKRNLGTLCPAKLKNRKIILLYHSVGDSTWAISKNLFDSQIDWLSDHCKVLPLTELINAEPSKDIQVSITFDDGYASLYDQVAPKLAEKKMSAMVYINTGWIGDNKNDRKESVSTLGHYPDESFLIWQEVKELYEAGWEIGSHGINHYNFAKTAPNLVYQELYLSKQHIEKYLNTNCFHFAYPWGRYSKMVKETLSLIGYRYAAAVVHAPIGRFVDYLALPRINISNEYSFADFKNIIIGKWDYLGLIQRIKRMLI